MSPRLFRQAPAVGTMIGGDAARGWLPPGAAEPLPDSPRAALLDVRILQDSDAFRLAWSAHDPATLALPSARGERACTELGEALKEAEVLFGLGASEWLIAPDGRDVSPAEVQRVVTASLAAHEAEDAWDDGWGLLVTPPRLEMFELETGTREALWLVSAPSGGAGYVVFYDGLSGDFGLGSGGPAGSFKYIGDYGPLWSTLVSM